MKSHSAVGALLLGIVFVASCTSGGATASPVTTDEGLLLNGFFVATDEEIAALDLDDVPLRLDIPHAEWERISTIDLGTLESRLTGVDYQDIDQESLHNRYYIADDMEGPWYQTVRGELVDALVAMDPDETEAVARDWLASDEWQMAHPNGADDSRVVAEVASLVNDLARLASEATSRNATIYLVQTQ